MTLLAEATQGIDKIEIVLVPVSAAEAADDDDSPYSAKMCPQPVELILEGMNDLLSPKRERRRVKKRRPASCAIIVHVTPRPREHRASPRRDCGGDGSSASGDDGPGGGDPPPHPKSEHGPRAEVFPQSESRACVPTYGRARS